MSDVVVVDYGSGNTRSMLNALSAAARREVDVTLSRDPDVIGGARHLVLPGVGAYGACMAKLDGAGVRAAFVDAVDRGTPTLAVCVGMQVLANRGHEFGLHDGLGLVRGDVRRLSDVTKSNLKLPHIAWTKVKHQAHPVFASLDDEPTFYFVHSYAFVADEPSDVLATAEYGARFTAAVARDNIVGTQFHPEKSGPAGLQFLANFMRWKP